MPSTSRVLPLQHLKSKILSDLSLLLLTLISHFTFQFHFLQGHGSPSDSSFVSSLHPLVGPGNHSFICPLKLPSQAISYPLCPCHKHPIQKQNSNPASLTPVPGAAEENKLWRWNTTQEPCASLGWVRKIPQWFFYVSLVSFLSHSPWWPLLTFTALL